MSALDSLRSLDVYRKTSRKTVIFLALGLVLTTGILFSTYHHVSAVTLQRQTYRTSEFVNRTRHGCTNCTHGDQLGDMSALGDEIAALYKPIVMPVSRHDFFDPETGKTHYTSDKVWDSLGKDLCIADIDTRLYDHPGQILSNDFNWEEADSLSAGMLNHFIYASIHGYSYRLVQSEPWPHGDRDGVWSRIPYLRRMLDECRVVAVIDADVVFQHLEIPFEWLMNRWNISQDTSLAMPWDVQYYTNNNGKKKPISWVIDPKGQLSINAGVVVAHSLPRTKDIVEAWIGCPDDPRFPGCAALRHGWPAEQGAFANYIRYAYNKTTDLKTIPCMDANGFPGQNMDCDGTFLRHFTSAKASTKSDVAFGILNSLTRVFAHHLKDAHADSHHGDER